MASRSALCPSLEVLSAFAAGSLTPKGRETIQNHLNDCPSCRSRITQLGQSTMPAAPLSAMAKEGPAVGEPLAVPLELLRHQTYEVKRELGRGGMGVVYLGFDRLMERPVVIKVVNKELLRKPGATERFLREIRSAARLQHPNVMATYAAIQEGDLLAFAMEYVPGVDLADTVRNLTAKGQRMPVPNACHYIRQAALGLQHVHDKGMVHRDIKPSNLVLVREGVRHTVKILDFGLAKTRGDKGAEIALIETSNDPSKTGAGRMLGTPDYMAPEQALDAATVDIRADIYSLGCSLYYLLTGRPPFRGKALIDILKAHAHETAPPAHELRPDVPPELSAVIAKAMAKSPEDRYQTPGEMARELLPFVVRGEAPAKTDVTPAPETRATADDETFAVRPESAHEAFVPGAPLATPPSGTAPTMPFVAGERHNKWALAGVAGVVVLVGVIIAVVTMSANTNKNPHGILAITGLPTGSLVKVDGDVREVARGDQGIGEVRLPAGDHSVEITADNAAYGPTKVYIAPGERRSIHAQFKTKPGAAAPQPPTQPLPPTAGPTTAATKAPEGPGTKVAEKPVTKAPPPGPIDPHVKMGIDAGVGLAGALIGTVSGAGNSTGPNTKPPPQKNPTTPNRSGSGFGQLSPPGPPESPLPELGSKGTSRKGTKKLSVNKRGNKPPAKQPDDERPKPAAAKAKPGANKSRSLKDYVPTIVSEAQPELLLAAYKDLEFARRPMYLFVPKFDGFENVYFVHPVTQAGRAGPASLDFFATINYSGTLRLMVKNYPLRRDKSKSRGSLIRILTNDKGTMKHLDAVEVPLQDEWTELEIDFNRQSLRIEQHGLDNDLDGLFVRWEFEEKASEQ